MIPIKVIEFCLELYFQIVKHLYFYVVIEF